MSHAACGSAAGSGGNEAAVQTFEKIVNLVSCLPKGRNQTGADVREDLRERQVRSLVATESLRNHRRNRPMVEIMPLQQRQKVMAQLINGFPDIGSSCQRAISQIV